MTKEQKQKLIKLRCKAWGITEDEYYCNQCSDFSIEDMARAYRRGKNKGRAELEKENAELLEKLKNQKADYETYYKSCYNAQKKAEGQLTKAKEIIKNLMVYVPVDLKEYEEAKQFISEVEK